MTWVIGPLCTDHMDTSCVDVCPVDCIHRYLGDDPDIPKNQLLIDPDVCIDCGVCEPECPGKRFIKIPQCRRNFGHLSRSMLGLPASQRSKAHARTSPNRQRKRWWRTASSGGRSFGDRLQRRSR